MQKSPKYKSVDLNSIKDRQKYFKNLHEEVNKSRMAVQTITSFKNSELSFKKKIDQVQQELHSSVSRINLESKKNVVLKQLINLMKGEMFNFQRTLKKEEQRNESQAEKKIKKIQYDIEQIYQKHNEQIAKINSLKESANGGRSERVVFSNLFKKLQKQIKQNEQMYKENLIKSEVAKDICKGNSGKSLSRVFLKDSFEQKGKNNRISETNIAIFPVQNNFFNTNKQDTAFITLQRQNGSEVKDRRRVHPNKQLYHSHVQEMNNSSRKFLQLISSYQNFIDKIKVHIGFSNIHEGFTFYQGIQRSNQILMSQIQNLQEEVCHYENQIKDIKLQKRQSECYENSKELPMGSCRRIRIPTQKVLKQEDDSINQIQILSEISQILNLPLVNQKFDDDNLRILDSKLDEILQESKFYQQFRNEIQKQQNRATTANSEGNIVDILLQRMDRFNQCEKILDKNLFKQEYIRELGKTKKHKSKK